MTPDVFDDEEIRFLQYVAGPIEVVRNSGNDVRAVIILGCNGKPARLLKSGLFYGLYRDDLGLIKTSETMDDILSYCGGAAAKGRGPSLP